MSNANVKSSEERAIQLSSLEAGRVSFNYLALRTEKPRAS